MPKKERPSALPDSVFSAKLEQAPDGISEEIPVQNTFIQFAAPGSSGQDAKKQLATAPAWMGPSFQSLIQQAFSQSPPAEAPPPPPPQGATLEAQPPSSAPEGTTSEDEASISPEKMLFPSHQNVLVTRHSSSTSSAQPVGPSKAFQTKQAADLDGEEDDDVYVDSLVESAFGRLPQAELKAPGTAAPSALSGPLPSMGSALHAEGSCKRCCFFPKGRCLNGVNCEFCHFEHEKRKRKKKKKSAGARRDAAGSDSEDDSNDGDAQEAGPLSGPAGSSMGASSWAQPDILCPARSGLPLTAPPPLPPRGLPLPNEPPPPAPHVQQPAGHRLPPAVHHALSADQYFGGGYDAMPPGVACAGGASPYPGHYGDPRLPYGHYGGYDQAAIAAQHQQAASAAAYQQPSSSTGRYLPPPR